MLKRCSPASLWLGLRALTIEAWPEVRSTLFFAFLVVGFIAGYGITFASLIIYFAKGTLPALGLWWVVEAVSAPVFVTLTCRFIRKDPMMCLSVVGTLVGIGAAVAYCDWADALLTRLGYSSAGPALLDTHLPLLARVELLPIEILALAAVLAAVLAGPCLIIWGIALPAVRAICERGAEERLMQAKTTQQADDFAV